MAELRIFGGSIVLPSSSIGDEQVKTPNSAENAIDADKLQHLYKPGTNFDLAIGGTPATREEIVFTATTAGVIRAVKALLNDTGTTGSVTVDCKLNGTTVLSATISISNSDSDRTVKEGTLSTTAFVAGDVLSLSLTQSASDGSGPFAWIELEEDAG